MEVRPLGLDGVVEILPRKFGDDRGFFSETYKAKALRDAGIDFNFVQDNHSFSAAKGVVRGLHYQLLPFAQDKLLRVVRGAILDVAVDIRKSSPTFGRWVAQEVSAEKWNQILVPKGFAHGFMTLVENTEVLYKVTDYYSPEHDRAIRYDDPAIGIDWPISASGIQTSDKDKNAPLLADAEVFA
ncbi:dTDP-4-dehydrorhamnose 3,5-epimerase [Ochrobactrum soli]|uniref:dTDP-4-dehydrorhamnose 3,5-epimerase n=1 Tax=Brucella/Ochrobactrum group TaxID=2826938 RepID=UPI000EF1CDAB|nr:MULTISPECIES: dTDP-4-dehydrorhamnose 3,5-epimerase [Brucella]MDX4076515.1 dTDP-4-dehydrorhamnose 3,5-epimerase [Brucella sp. NBRC 113783]RLL64491.1 dTDP-4-dehydrorhamnose 3,5-epimerase [[Ochrobactrum] soli]